MLAYYTTRRQYARAILFADFRKLERSAGRSAPEKRERESERWSHSRFHGSVHLSILLRPLNMSERRDGRASTWSCRFARRARLRDSQKYSRAVADERERERDLSRPFTSRRSSSSATYSPLRRLCLRSPSSDSFPHACLPRLVPLSPASDRAQFLPLDYSFHSRWKCTRNV